MHKCVCYVHTMKLLSWNISFPAPLPLYPSHSEYSHVYGSNWLHIQRRLFQSLSRASFSNLVCVHNQRTCREGAHNQLQADVDLETSPVNFRKSVVISRFLAPFRYQIYRMKPLNLNRHEKCPFLSKCSDWSVLLLRFYKQFFVMDQFILQNF